MQFIENLKLKAGVFLRERKERAEERKAAKREDTPHGASPLLWCWFITLVGVFALGGSTWMLAVFIAGSVGHLDWFSDYVATDAGVERWEWRFDATVHWFNAIGLWLLCAAIGIFNAVWIELRKHFYGVFKNWITGLGLATALFMVAGGVVVQQRGTDARTRDEVAAVGAAQAGVAAIDAEIESLERRWATLCAANLTTYQAQACRSGETAWRERIETARAQRDYQLPGIERALADAREGDRMQSRLTQLRASRSTAAVQSVQAETVAVRATGWMAPVTTFIEDLRKPTTSVLGELLAMTAFPMALAAWATRRRRRDTESSGWADKGHRIEDLREQEPIASEPFQMQTVMEEENVETGEKKRMITPKPYWRTVKKGKKEQVTVAPDFPADEVGVSHDGGGRMGSVEKNDRSSDAEEQNSERRATDTDNAEHEPAAILGAPPVEVVPVDADEIQDLSSELPDDFSAEDALLIAEAESAAEQSDVASDTANTDSAPEHEAEQVEHHQPRTEPEQDERKLLANVAAE